MSLKVAWNDLVEQLRDKEKLIHFTLEAFATSFIYFYLSYIINENLVVSFFVYLFYVPQIFAAQLLFYLIWDYFLESFYWKVEIKPFIITKKVFPVLDKKERIRKVVKKKIYVFPYDLLLSFLLFGIHIPLYSQLPQLTAPSVKYKRKNWVVKYFGPLDLDLPYNLFTFFAISFSLVTGILSLLNPSIVFALLIFYFLRLVPFGTFLNALLIKLSEKLSKEEKKVSFSTIYFEGDFFAPVFGKKLMRIVFFLSTLSILSLLLPGFGIITAIAIYFLLWYVSIFQPNWK